MSQMNDFKRELKAAKKLRLPWYVMLLIFVIGAPVTFLFALYGQLAIALPLLNMIGVLGFVIALKWKLRRELWFWITMIVIAAIHLLLLFVIPWTEKWVPALAISAIDSADLCLILWVLVAIARVVGRGPTHRKP